MRDQIEQNNTTRKPIDCPTDPQSKLISCKEKTICPFDDTITANVEKTKNHSGLEESGLRRYENSPDDDLPRSEHSEEPNKDVVSIIDSHEQVKRGQTNKHVYLQRPEHFAEIISAPTGIDGAKNPENKCTCVITNTDNKSLIAEKEHVYFKNEGFDQNFEKEKQNVQISNIFDDEKSQ